MVRITSVPAVRPDQLIDGVESTQETRECRLGRDVCFLLLGVLVLTANQMFASGIRLPWITSAIGGLCVLAVPTFLLCGARVIPARSGSERVAVSAVLTVLGLMIAGLAANTVLPLFSVRDPLGTTSAILTVDLLIVGLAAWARRRHPAVYVIRMPALGRADGVVLGLGGVVLALAVVGAVRLNNGAGGGVTLVMLAAALVESGLLLAWRKRLNPGVVTIAIYGLSLALLFMTSLRGWDTTGHDVQREYQAFQRTSANGKWSMALFRDSYNACLSITILPTLIKEWTRVDDPYVYKFFFQVLFASCPVMLFNLARRMAPIGASLLASLFFVSFVTFFQDMPMLNRQEVAFLFFAAGLLAVFNDHLSIRSRRWWFCLFAVGMVLSHYSTTYVAVGVVGLAWLVGRVAVPILTAASRVVPRVAERAIRVLDSGTERRVLTIGPVLGVAVIAAMWGAVTQTEDGLVGTVSATIEDLRGGTGASKSGDTSYSIFPVRRSTPAERLAEYEAASVASAAEGRTAGTYYPDQLVSQYPTAVAADATLPLTAVGRGLSSIGINVSALNYLIRQASARILQLLAVVGLAVVLFARHRVIRPPPEYVLLAIASILVVFLQVVLPVVSVNYGLLRAFQQALLVLNVLLVAGSLALVPRRAARMRNAAVSVLVLALFASSTGVFTQLVGGYGPQLHLNNSGTYYDIYYLHPEEIAGIGWLQRHVSAVNGDNAQSEIQADRYTAMRVQALIPRPIRDDIHPAVVGRESYVFLGVSTVAMGKSTVPVDGDLTTYRYPMPFLDDNKDLIYSNGGSRVYR